jgi:2-amino-4-hydroxy-6-hydroxymethyldihydropteridine diphosphokinase
MKASVGGCPSASPKLGTWGRKLRFTLPNTAYLSLGSNVGDRDGNLRDAIRRLRALGKILQISSFYETEPVEFTAQSWFLNCVVELETEETAEELMAHLLGIEEQMGRKRTQKKGPRNIDIDILLFGDLIVEADGLTVPHPALQERRFVLEPLAEIASDARHPVLKHTIRELLDSLPPGQTVRKT